MVLTVLLVTDNVCIESLSIDLTRPMLDSAARSVTRLGDKIEEIKKTDASKLQDEYAKLVEGLQEAAEEEDPFMSNPGKITRLSLPNESPFTMSMILRPCSST